MLLNVLNYLLLVLSLNHNFLPLVIQNVIQLFWGKFLFEVPELIVELQGLVRSPRINVSDVDHAVVIEKDFRHEEYVDRLFLADAQLGSEEFLETFDLESSGTLHESLAVTNLWLLMRTEMELSDSQIFGTVF